MVQTVAEELGRIPMSPALQASLKRARDYASLQGHKQVLLEHLLLALTEDEDAAAVLNACRVDLDRLRNDVAGHIGGETERTPDGTPSEPAISTGLTQILKYATLAARQGKRPRIDGAIVLAAIVGDGRSMAAAFLKAQGLTFEAAIRALQQAAPAPRRAALPTENLSGSPAANAPAPPVATIGAPGAGSAGKPSAGGREPPPVAAAVPAGRPVGAEDILAAARARIEQRGVIARPDPRGTVEPAEPAAAIASGGAGAAARFGEPSSAHAVVDPAGQPSPSRAPIIERFDRPAGAAGPLAGGEARPGETGEFTPFPDVAQRPGEPTGPQAAPGTAPSAMTPAAPPRPEPPLAVTTALPETPALSQTPVAGSWTPPPLPVLPRATDGASRQPRPAMPPPGLPPRSLPLSPPPPQRTAPPGGAAVPWSGVNDVLPPAQAPLQVPPQASAAHPSPLAAAPAQGLEPGAPMMRPPAATPPQGVAVGPGHAGAGYPSARQMGPVLDPGHVSHNIPARMTAGLARTVEVRVTRPPLAAASPTMPISLRGEVVAVRAIGVRLRPLKGGCIVDAPTPETAWDKPSPAGRLAGEAAVWRFVVTPPRSGRVELSLQVTSHVVGADGVVAGTALPEQTVALRIVPDFLGAARRWGIALAVLVGSLVMAEGIEMAFKVNVLTLLRRLFV